MNDDFNTPAAIAVLSDMVRWANTLLTEGRPTKRVLERANEAFDRLGGDVLGIVTAELLGDEAAGGLENSLMELLISLRNELRKAKNFEAADKIRKGLAASGVELKDSPEGTTWKRS